MQTRQAITPLATGVHADVDAARYHADDLCAEPSLSSSLAKVLVTQTPRAAWLQHPRLNARFNPFETGSDKFALGDATHDTLSSDGRRIDLAPFNDWKSGDARKFRDKSRAQGRVPLTKPQAVQVAGIAATTLNQLVRLKIDLGAQEHVFIAHNHGATLRAMMDSFAPPFVRDFKCTKINLANDVTVGRHLVEMGYDLRAWFYLHVAGLVFPEWAGRLRFEWIMVEEDEPHGVRIVEADATFLEMGRRKGQHAIRLWERCMASGVWPHLEDLSRTVPYPNWAENQWLERETSDPAFVQGPMATLRQSLIDEETA